MINKSVKQLLSAFSLAALTATFAFGTAAVSNNTFVGRSMADDNARELFAIQNAWSAECAESGWHGAFTVAGEYKQSFRDDKADGLGSRWSVNGTNKMTVGNNNSAAPKFDLDAYQLGLGNITNADSSVTLSPKLYQAGANFNLYLGQHAEECGFWLQLSGPVGVASVNPKLAENGTIQGNAYTAGDLDASLAAAGAAPVAPTNTAAPNKTVAQAFAGTAQALGAWQPLKKGKVSADKLTTGAKFGDLAMDLGYNFMANEDGHLGLAVRVTAPTGNQTTGEYVMEPIFGNGAGWGLGGKLLGHYDLWHGDNDNMLQVWMDVQATHLFKKKCQRTFDLTANGPGSKYLLVADYQGGSNQNVIQNLANVSTLDAEVSVNAIIDGAISFQYLTGNWNMGLGYNFFGRTDEKVVITGELSAQRYAVLGQAANARATDSTSVNQGLPTAKINGSMQNSNVSINGAPNAANRIAGTNALDEKSAMQAAGWSSKVFGNIEYRWNDSDYCPYLGVLGSGEFSHSDNNALNQWGVAVQAGISF